MPVMTLFRKECEISEIFTVTLSLVKEGNYQDLGWVDFIFEEGGQFSVAC